MDEVLLPGDANRDLVFDQLDVIQLRSAGKYLTGRPSTWGEGDFNGDGVFDQRDQVAAMQTGSYLRGPYAEAVTGAAPSPRGGAPAVWLSTTSWPPASRRLILFGGMQPITGDTYSLGDDIGWLELTNGTAPAPRCHHTLVNDGAGALMFGGFTTRGGREGRFNDTHRFDPATSCWVRLEPTGDIPQARCLHAAAWIPSTREMLIHGGIQGGGQFASDFFLDTSILDVKRNRWERMQLAPGPGARAGAVAFYASADDAVYFWGGRQVTPRSLDYPNQLWRFDPGRRVWEAVAVAGQMPLGREDPTHFWDDTDGLLYLFHGDNQFEGGLIDDAYVLHLNERRWEWFEADNGPSPRWRASAAFDPGTGTGWMFGGWQGFATGMRNDTWRFDTQTRTWSRVCRQYRRLQR